MQRNPQFSGYGYAAPAIRDEAREVVNYALTVMSLVISGNTALGFFDKESVIVVPLVILALVAAYRRKTFAVRDGLILAFFGFICAIHLVEFGSTTITSGAGLLLRLSTGLLIARVIDDFPRRYVETMFWLSLLSSVFFVPVLLGADLAAVFEPFSIPLTSGEIHIGIHNFTPGEERDIPRNAGFFWEPGAFAGYLVLALVFMLKEPGAVRRNRLYVIVAALISTFSTTGYIAFVVVMPVVLWLRVRGKYRFTGRFVAAVVGAAGFMLAAVAFQDLEFLNQKMLDQYEASVAGEERSHFTRYGNFLFDMEYISARPLFGWSASEEARQVDTEIVMGQGNGLSGFAVRYGLLGLAAYFWFCFGAMTRRYGSRGRAGLATLVVALLLIGEQFLNFPLFLSLAFYTNAAANRASNVRN